MDEAPGSRLVSPVIDSGDQGSQMDEKSVVDRASLRGTMTEWNE
tara:strand:+ start:152 stop:283 length:132 start_codon:yes stop_codon:yes gene_type:complete